jgi:heterodisulfide reductase subunit C
MTPVTVEIREIDGTLAGEVKASSGASAMSCFQCAKCSSGCPVAARADIKPHELVRLVQTDQREAVLTSRYLWECTSCQTCVTRCPQKVDIPAMNDALRALSLREGKAAADTAVPVFNDAFLKIVRRRGRVHELSLMAAFKLRTRRLLEDTDKAPMMLMKGKLPLLGGRGGDRAEREELFRRAARARQAEDDAAKEGAAQAGTSQEGATRSIASQASASQAGATQNDASAGGAPRGGGR